MSKTHLVLLYSLATLALFLSVYALLRLSESTEVQGEFYTPEEQLGMTNPGNVGSEIRLFDLPKELTFAGEVVPIELPDVRERLEREIYVNAYWQSNMILLMKRSSKFLPEIEASLVAQGIPEDFKYLAMAESGLMNVASSAGAKGFWQILESTGKEYGLEISPDVDERYHLEKSTKAATAYFKKAHAKFGDWTAVAASYNMGQTGFARRQTEQLIQNYYDLYLNDETSRYLFRILAFKVIFENPGEFGFKLRDQDFYTNPPMREIAVNADVKDLANWAKLQGSSYKELKLYNPWLRDRNLNVKRGKSYFISLPE